MQGANMTSITASAFRVRLPDLIPVLLAMAAPEVSRIRRLLLKLIQENPGLRQVIMGLGQSVDPYPTCYRSTFITDDHLALAEDWLVVGRDMRAGLQEAEHYVRQGAGRPPTKRGA
jgi:hypothetical protein